MRIIPVSIICVLLICAGVLPAAENPPDGPDGLKPPESEPFTLRSEDGTEIACELFRNGSDSIVVVCPGFYNSKDNRWMRKTGEMLIPRYDVLMFDFRGHGKSGGKYAWSSKEYMDVDAVLDFAASKGYKHTGIIGFSLGAASAVNAASGRTDIDSMILISCPSNFNAIDFRFWEPGMFSDLWDNIESGWQGKGARSGNFFLAKMRPIDSIQKIRDTPILFIHGDRDWVVKDRHSKKLFAASAASLKRLEIVKGGLHAERMIQSDPDSIERLILAWFMDTLEDGGRE